MFGQTEVVKVLLNYTAYIDVETTRGLTPLTFGIFLNVFFLFK